MVRRPTTERSPSVYALVVASEPIGDSRTVRISLHQGTETLWSLTESLRAENALEPLLIAVWRVLGEAARRRIHRLGVYVDSAELIDLLERRTPVPAELGKHFLLARSRLNQFGRVRLGMLRDAPRAPASASRPRDGQPSLFDPAVA